MDRLIINVPVPHFSMSEPIEYGKKDSVPLDQSAVQSFNIDPASGRPIYDLTAILRAETKADQQKVLDSLTKFDSDFLPDDVTNDMALQYSFPRYAQMPSELVELTEKVNRAKFEEWKKSKAIEDEEQAKKEYEELVNSIRGKKFSTDEVVDFKK